MRLYRTCMEGAHVSSDGEDEGYLQADRHRNMRLRQRLVSCFDSFA